MVLEEHRPTPEEILKKIRMIDPDETRVRQGRLKIFFGLCGRRGENLCHAGDGPPDERYGRGRGGRVY